MKKTISTSIGRIVFNVEEDAHDKLAAYLDAIGDSLKGSEGKDEIMADIEARIAEILQQKINNSNQVVTLEEIDEVISIMGKPEDFGAGAGAQNQQTFSSPGNYRYNNYRRVFRDPDDKVIFGVCSGLSHHFGFDPIWLRLAFGLSFLIWGFGLLLYILLAIIIPKARTTAEKLEMKGEPVDVNTIRKTIEDDLEHLGKRVKDFGEDMRSGKGKDRARQFGQDLGDFFNSTGQGLGLFLGNVVKGILIFVSILIALVLALLILGIVTSLKTGVNFIEINGSNHHALNYSVNNFFSMLSVSGGMRVILIIGIILFLGVPLLGILVRLIRMAAGRKRPVQWFTISAGLLWGISWVFLIIGIASISSHFSVNDFMRSDNKLTIQPPAKMLYVKIDNSRDYIENAAEFDSATVYLNDEGELHQSPSLCIEQSPDTNYHLVETKIARGINKAEADEYAETINYTYVNHDSTLTLVPDFSLDVERGWRKQKLDLTLQVPVNKSVSLPDGVDHILCKAIRKKGQHLGGQKWTMSPTGLVSANR
jgi:phage shock protein PspC (stress-responsive transcriptional regulator)